MTSLPEFLAKIQNNFTHYTKSNVFILAYTKMAAGAKKKAPPPPPQKKNNNKKTTKKQTPNNNSISLEPLALKTTTTFKCILECPLQKMFKFKSWGKSNPCQCYTSLNMNIKY